MSRHTYKSTLSIITFFLLTFLINSTGRSQPPPPIYVYLVNSYPAGYSGGAGSFSYSYSGIPLSRWNNSPFTLTLGGGTTYHNFLTYPDWDHPTGTLYKHHDWNSVSSDYLLKNSKYYTTGISNSVSLTANYQTAYTSISVLTDLDGSGTGGVLSYSDPWYTPQSASMPYPVQDNSYYSKSVSGSGFQPGLSPNLSNVGVFLNQGDKTNLQPPYYSFQTPYLAIGTLSPTSIVFDQYTLLPMYWDDLNSTGTSTGVDFVSLPAANTTATIFKNSNATAVAHYKLHNTVRGTTTSAPTDIDKYANQRKSAVESHYRYESTGWVRYIYVHRVYASAGVIYYTMSNDGGFSWSPEIIVSDRTRPYASNPSIVLFEQMETENQNFAGNFGLQVTTQDGKLHPRGIGIVWEDDVNLIPSNCSCDKHKHIWAKVRVPAPTDYLSNELLADYLPDVSFPSNWTNILNVDAWQPSSTDPCMSGGGPPNPQLLTATLNPDATPTIAFERLVSGGVSNFCLYAFYTRIENNSGTDGIWATKINLAATEVDVNNSLYSFQISKDGSGSVETNGIANLNVSSRYPSAATYDVVGPQGESHMGLAWQMNVPHLVATPLSGYAANICLNEIYYSDLFVTTKSGGLGSDKCFPATVTFSTCKIAPWIEDVSTSLGHTNNVIPSLSFGHNKTTITSTATTGAVNAIPYIAWQAQLTPIIAASIPGTLPTTGNPLGIVHVRNRGVQLVAQPIVTWGRAASGVSSPLAQPVVWWWDANKVYSYNTISVQTHPNDASYDCASASWQKAGTGNFFVSRINWKSMATATYAPTQRAILRVGYSPIMAFGETDSLRISFDNYAPLGAARIMTGQ